MACSAGSAMVMPRTAPSVSQVINASDMAPYYAIAVELDLSLAAELSTGLASRPVSATTDTQACEPGNDVTATAFRLVRLLQDRKALPVLATPTLRELHYWLLAGRHGRAIQSMLRPGRKHQSIERVVSFLRAEFAQPMSIDRLAATAGMSPSSLHRNFKAATGCTPLQFQKLLRLREARRLILSEDSSVSIAAFTVGYESPAQFSREYRRTFGRSPAHDAKLNGIRARRQY